MQLVFCIGGILKEALHKAVPLCHGSVLTEFFTAALALLF